MTPLEWLRNENYSRTTCLCGLFPSLGRVVESVRKELDAISVTVTNEYIIAVTECTPLSPIRYRYADSGDHIVYVPNPLKNGIIIHDLTCCGLPQCVALLYDMLEDFFGERISINDGIIYGEDGKPICPIPSISQSMVSQSDQ